MTDALQIIPIPAFADNYIWLMHQGAQAIVIDPGDAAPVLTTLKKLHLSLHSILITHHHHDHIGGVQDLIAQFPHCQVYAPKAGQYDFPHIAVGEGDAVTIALQSAQQTQKVDLRFNVMALPGHTLDHIAYVLNWEKAPWLFCGDTLFGAGCGRLFEGTPRQMLTSLKKLAQLVPTTKVFCTHEYTLENIAFALTLEPQNQALIARKLDTETLRNRNQPSLPSTIALELATNPFLRCHVEAIKCAINKKYAAELDTFTQLRNLRNAY